MLVTGVVACLLGVLIALGFWQLDRADQKKRMLEAYHQRTTAPPERLTLPLETPAKWRYRHVTLTGRFDGEHQFLLDNQIKHRRVGFDVLTPFEPQNNGKALLIDRGWVPLRGDRSELPNTDVANRQVELTGTVYVPYGQGFRLGGMDEGQRGWPRIVQFVDYAVMSERLGVQLAPLTIRLDSASPYGYLRDWQVVPLKPAKHLGYAVQWFAMAVALVILYLVFSVRRTEDRSPQARAGQ